MGILQDYADRQNRFERRNQQQADLPANHGTTGETNNLNLGVCKMKPGKGGNHPYVQFVESLPKA